MKRCSSPTSDHRRRGSMLPVVVFGLLVVGGAMALVFDRLWLDEAQLEMRAGADAAALAAANSLICDDLLRPGADLTQIVTNSRTAAANIAAQNYVVGLPLTLDTSETGDIRFGRIMLDGEGNQLFLETETNPTSVVVFAKRDKTHQNPISLFFCNLTGKYSEDLTVPSEVSVDNRIVGLRPLPTIPVPAFPFAILHQDPLRKDTWMQQIEAGLGSDLYSFDPVSGKVTSGSDGIREITLTCVPTKASGNDLTKANLQLVDVGNGLQETKVVTQIQNGWTQADMTTWGLDELRLDGTLPLLSSQPKLTPNIQNALELAVGQQRVCLLYTGFVPANGTSSGTTGTNAGGTLTVCGLSAGRVLQVLPGKDGACQVVFQPTVMCTRSAILSSDSPAWTGLPDEQSTTNPYIYKMHITH